MVYRWKIITMDSSNIDTPCIIGWREWVSLPELGIKRIKVKIDTGARTSALHTDFIEPYIDNGVKRVRFGLAPSKKNKNCKVTCDVEIIDERQVTNSGGQKETRYVISTPIKVGNIDKIIEITLTKRDTMKFKMLLGRTALMDDFLVNTSKSYVTGKNI